MTEPTRVGGVLPEVLAEVVDRAGHGYERWAELVAQAGYCHHPIRLAGRIDQADRTTGEVRTVYDSEREPDGVLLKACGTRRESRCPSCAPPTGPTPTSSSPPASRAARVSLSPWQGTPAAGDLHRPELRSGPHQQGLGAPRPAVSPHRQGARCSHGNRAGSWHRHSEDDPRLGEPLYPSCYDAQAQVLRNALAPELWRRTTIALHRALGRLAGLQERELRRLVRISYAKVAELQRRGAIHVVIRLDAATDCRCPGCLAPPPGGFTAAVLEDALRLAVPAVRVPCPAPGGRRPGAVCPLGRAARRPQHRPHRRPGGGAVGRAGGYIAKYATKATESFGAGLDHRLGDDLEHLDGLPAHVAEHVRACWELDGLRLRAWAHMLGFRGHWSTKSRRYSTTFTVLRRARVAFAKRRRARDGVPLDAWGRPEDDQAVIVLATWSYVASGYVTEGERWLALSAAARAREQRRVAWEDYAQPQHEQELETMTTSC